MKTKPILIVAGEPKSIFFEILFKSIQKTYFKSPLIIIASKKLILSEMKKSKFSKKINLLHLDDLKKNNINKRSINLINVSCPNINNTNLYIKDCFDVAFKILKSGLTNKMINGPINKSKFLNKKFLGMTEYISKKFHSKKTAMLIYNKEISVCPITTHLPLKMVSKKINQKLIVEKVILINNFYKKNFGFYPKMAITGLNPHCESNFKTSEEDKIIKPSLKILKKIYSNVSGPYPADSLFMKNNIRKFDVIVGMYHDQVLTPIKTIYNFDAINITLGLPFLRISPDHGTNYTMIGKNKSDPQSLIAAIKFLDSR